MKIYRVKDTDTGKYLTTTVDQRVSLTKRGRIFTQVGYVKECFRNRGDQLAVFLGLILPEHKYAKRFTEQREAYNALPIKWPHFLPDTLIVVDETDTPVITLRELILRSMK